MSRKSKDQSSQSDDQSCQLTAGTFSLDVDARQLMKKGSSVKLTPKETALLETFMTHCGKVLTRRFLMEKVWATEYIGDTRTLEVHVCWIRKHIEEDPSQPIFLRTFRGVGYGFYPDQLS